MKTHYLSIQSIHPKVHVSACLDLICIHTRHEIEIGDALVTNKGHFTAQANEHISGNKKDSQYFKGCNFYEFAITKK